jgi:hypothetical protein
MSTQPVLVILKVQALDAWEMPQYSTTTRCINPKERANYISYVTFNLLKPIGHVMYQQFNIQQLYARPTLYLCFLYLSENKQRLVPLTA